MMSSTRLAAIAEDIEYFGKWWERSQDIGPATIRHGSAALRRLLVEDDAGQAWRQAGFSKEPMLDGPDLLGMLAKRGVDVGLVVSAAAAGLRFDNIDWAFLGAHRADNPTMGVAATAPEGFAVVVLTTAREVGDRPDQPPLNDPLVYRKSVFA
jgi:hypothetical protein